MLNNLLIAISGAFQNIPEIISRPNGA